jgi:hypothetical protein
MNQDERQFEELVKKLNLDDKPDYRHRDKLQQEMLAAFAKRQWQQEKQSRQTRIWRTIMQSRITKLAAAAAVVAVVGIVSWLGFRPETFEPMSSLAFLAKVQAAEQSLFMGNRIIHLLTEITVYPGTQPKASEMLDELGDTTKSEKELNVLIKDFANSMLTIWIPVSSVKPDGGLAENKLDVADNNGRNQTILDETWYEPSTGRFARVMESEGKTLFANAYDGQFVYTSQAGPNGTLAIKGNAAVGDFRSPENPAEFLGMTAGVKLCLSDKCLRQPVRYTGRETLGDGTIVHVYKAGFEDLWGGLNTYYEFKVRQPDEIVAEIACVSRGERRLTIRRTLSESVDKANLSWNLAELSPEELATEPNTTIAVKNDTAIPNVSVRHMVERAGFETYILENSPSWTHQRIIVDVPDEVSSQRMFVTIYYAGDNRHIILAQSQTHNKFMTNVKQQVESRGGSMETLDYANGCKLWKSSGDTDKWWTEITLRLSGFTPAEDRSGYIIETPAETFVIVAVNGRLTETERDALVNSLIPAREYQVE